MVFLYFNDPLHKVAGVVNYRSLHICLLDLIKMSYLLFGIFSFHWIVISNVLLLSHVMALIAFVNLSHKLHYLNYYVVFLECKGTVFYDWCEFSVCSVSSSEVLCRTSPLDSTETGQLQLSGTKKGFVEVTIDNAALTRDHYKYSYCEDPVIFNIFPNRSILRLVPENFTGKYRDPHSPQSFSVMFSYSVYVLFYFSSNYMMVFSWISPLSRWV